MTRRASLLAVTILVACAPDEVKLDTSDLSFAADGVEMRAESLSDASGELLSHVEEFDSENWQEVVPQIRDDAETLASEIDSLQSDVTDLKDRVEELETQLAEVRCASRDADGRE